MIESLFENYCITSSRLYECNSTTFFGKNLNEIVLNHRIQKACFRENRFLLFLDDLVETFAKWCQDYQIEGFLNLANTASSIFFAKKYGLVGVHIKEAQIHTIGNAVDEGMEVFYSAHYDTQVQEALSLGANFVTLSPIFPTPHKGTPLGLKYLDSIDTHFKKHLFALGGILTHEQINQVRLAGVRGFGSIRYFDSKKDI